MKQKREAYCSDDVAKDGTILQATQKKVTAVDARIDIVLELWIRNGYRGSRQDCGRKGWLAVASTEYRNEWAK
jgi:hypothetical protein